MKKTQDDSLAVRCVYMHDGGFFSKIYSIPTPLFEKIREALDKEGYYEDSVGMLIHIEESWKTV